ncbi:coiled-coil domain-containing protein 113 [Protopterus annectens]|uniref:coiled-coil domain-containing protein 113 n=1 Tax=Protopterus annectens TaxID=7888 RepID=UPI001CFAE89A|nr:coiled-coil domain-containing protein 113 [Protopterus annectens]
MADGDTDSGHTDFQSEEPQHLDQLNHHQLQHLLDELCHYNAALMAETEMFDKYLKSLDPKDLVPQPAVEGTHASQDFVQTRSRRKSKSRSVSIERLQQLTVEEKCDIAQRELEDIKEETEKLKENSQRVLNNYKATLEEAEIHSTELKKSLYEFDRDIVKDFSEKHGGVAAADKVYRYMEDKIRARDSLAEKLRLKNAALKVHNKKLKLQLKQKEEMGEVLHEVDFQQLKIENKQFLEKIDERNQDLLRLKLMAANTLQILNTYKRKLQNMTDESARLNKEFASRQDMLQRINKENKLVEEERDKAEHINKQLRTEMSDYRVPSVMEYVNSKADHTDFQKNVKAWERKVEIAEMSLKNHRKAWNQIKMSSA